MEEQKVNKIRELRREGKTISKIAKEMDCCLATIHYWLNEERRQKIIRKRIEEFKNKTLEQRREIYRKRQKYNTEYFRKKYQTNKAFRKNHLERVKERRKIKKLK